MRDSETENKRTRTHVCKKHTWGFGGAFSKITNQQKTEALQTDQIQGDTGR